MLRHLLAALSLVLVARSQAPSPWASLHVPGGVVPTLAVSQGKVVAYRDLGLLHAWSAVSRRWASMALGGSATLRLNNDCLLAQDGTTWTAFSSYRGRFEPLTVGANAVLLNPAANANDSLLLVVDGNQLHAFSAFVGVWTSRPIAASYLAAVQRHTGVVVMGTTVSGIDAATGQWHDHVVATAPTTVTADGTAAFAFGAGTVHAFSASHANWRDHPEVPGAAFVRADDWGVWYAGSRVLGYSGIRGEFAACNRPATAVVATQDLFALLDGAGGVFGFSAIAGTFSAPLAAPGATVNSHTTVALLTDAAGTWGYSAVHHRVAKCANPGPTTGVANIVAWVSDNNGGPPRFFSSLTGLWYQAPASVLSGDPVSTTTGAASATATGCVAFSPRTGAFVPLLDPTIALVGSANSAPLIAVGATSLHAFEPRSGRWISTPRANTGAVTPQIWRTGAVMFDGNTLFGFGSQAGSWTAQVLPGPVTGLRANSESLRVSTPNDVFVWSAMGEVSWFAQFPEFRRVQPNDLALPLVVNVPAGGVAILGIGRLATAPMPLPGLGDLLLVPGTLVAMLVPGQASGDPVVVTVPSPLVAPHTGDEFAVQAAVLQPGGIPYLTDVATVMPL